MGLNRGMFNHGVVVKSPSQVSGEGVFNVPTKARQELKFFCRVDTVHRTSSLGDFVNDYSRLVEVTVEYTPDARMIQTGWLLFYQGREFVINSIRQDGTELFRIVGEAAV